MSKNTLDIFSQKYAINLLVGIVFLLIYWTANYFNLINVFIEGAEYIHDLWIYLIVVFILNLIFEFYKNRKINIIANLLFFIVFTITMFFASVFFVLAFPKKQFNLPNKYYQNSPSTIVNNGLLTES